MTDQNPYQPQQPPQPAPAYNPNYAAAGPRTNTLAIIALILGFVVPPGGIITGHIALSQIKKTGEAGHGLALAGTILGYVFTAFYIIFFIIYIVFIVALVGTHGFSSTGTGY